MTSWLRVYINGVIISWYLCTGSLMMVSLLVFQLSWKMLLFHLKRNIDGQLLGYPVTSSVTSSSSWKIPIIVRRAGLLWLWTRFWVAVICPIIKCLTVLEFSFLLFDLCLFITIFNFILNYVPIITFWIFTYHKIWILLIIFCFICNYWIIYFLTCLEVFCSVVS